MSVLGFGRGRRKKTIGIIGCGAIGSEIAMAVDNGDIGVELLGFNDLNRGNYHLLAAKLKNIHKLEFFESIEELVKKCDLVIECASKDAVKEVFEQAILRKKDVMILSVGGVLENMGLFEEAKKKRINIYIPSGAVIGVDGLEAAKFKGLQKVTLITKKPPAAFRGNEYLIKNNINIDEIKVETILFDGNAAEAVKVFPANVNVAATLSIAGVGPQKTHVKIVADPLVTRNTHEIIVEGEFGRFKVITENLPSPNNPKTSYLTALSSIVTLKNIVDPLHIGT